MRKQLQARPLGMKILQGFGLFWGILFFGCFRLAFGFLNPTALKFTFLSLNFLGCTIPQRVAKNIVFPSRVTVLSIMQDGRDARRANKGSMPCAQNSEVPFHESNHQPPLQAENPKPQTLNPKPYQA